MIGHNADAGVAVHSDDQPTLFHYVQWHIGDYKEGTANMTFEIEGAYMRFLMELYGSGKPLPDDDLIMAKRMGTVTRVWRRIREMLISVGKIIARNGCLTNARFERERQVRAEEIKNRSAAATARWRKGSRKTVEAAVQGDCNGVTKRLQSAIDCEKTNKINETSLEVHMLTNNHKPIIEKKDISSLRSEGAEAPQIETAAEIVWGKGLDWLRTASFVKSEVKLRSRVGGWVKDYGPDPVLAAFRAAQRAKPGEVMSWLEKVLRENDRADQHVKRQGGRLEVFNGFQAELSEILGNRDLRRSLDRIAGKIPVHVTGVELESRVRSIAVEMVEETEERDRRYAKAAISNKKSEDKCL